MVSKSVCSANKRGDILEPFTKCNRPNIIHVVWLAKGREGGLEACYITSGGSVLCSTFI